MAQPRTLALTPELEAVYRAGGGRRRPPPVLSAPAIAQRAEKTRSAPQAPPAEGSQASTIHNTIGGICWSPEQERAFNRGASWDEVDQMDPWRCRRCGGHMRQPLNGPKRCGTCGDQPS